MLEAVTADSIYTTILFLRQHGDDRTVVVVEGTADASALAAFVDAATANLLPCGSKSALDGVIGIIDARGDERVLGIRDRDWVGLLHPRGSSPNLVYTDAYDLLMTLAVRSEAIDRVLSYECGADAAFRLAGAAGVASAFEAIINSASKVGALRFVSEKSALGMAMRNLPVGQFVDATTAKCDTDALVTFASQRSRVQMLPPAQEVVMREVDRLSAEPDRLQMYCCGHDVCRILAHWCRANGSGSIGAKTVAGYLMIGIQWDQLHLTKLYSQVLAWADDHRTRIWLHAA